MSSARGRVRSRRKFPTVAVTGAASPVAAGIVRAFAAAAVEVDRRGSGNGGNGGNDGAGSATDRRGEPSVVAIDDKRGDIDDVSWRIVDITSPLVAAALEGVEALVHVAAATTLTDTTRPRERRERTLRRVQTLATAATAAGVRHLVVVTSAMTYGASPHHVVPLPEATPVQLEPDEGLVGDLLAVEQLLETVRTVHPGLQVTVVRPAALVGATIDTVITRHFEAPRLLTIKGGCPAWQFCHVDDLASALVRVVEHRLGPVVTVGSIGVLTQDEVEQLSGMRRIELSAGAAEGAAQRLHRLGVFRTPATDLAFAVYPWAIASETLLADGWEPAYDNQTCLGVLLAAIAGHHAVAARRVDRKDAALGAASAAVALGATAAIMRRRRHQGG